MRQNRATATRTERTCERCAERHGAEALVEGDILGTGSMRAGSSVSVLLEEIDTFGLVFFLRVLLRGLSALLRGDVYSEGGSRAHAERLAQGAWRAGQALGDPGGARSKVIAGRGYFLCLNIAGRDPAG